MTGKQLLTEAFSYIQGLAEAISTQKESKHLGHVSQQLCTYARTFAIALLEKEKDTQGFFYWLTQSALVRKYYLEKCKLENSLSAGYRRSGLSNAFLDAIAAGQWELAKEIGELSHSQWMQGEEYEDDFAYARFLYILIVNMETNVKKAALLQLIQQYEDVLEGNEDIRLDVCKALFYTDQKAFDYSFNKLLEQSADQPKKQYNSDPMQKLNNKVSVEGLAILKIAERLGLKTKAKYKLCPGEVCVPHPVDSRPAFSFLQP